MTDGGGTGPPAQDPADLPALPSPHLVRGLDAEDAQGTAGVAVLKYRGGIPKTGIKSVTFAEAKPRKAAEVKRKWLDAVGIDDSHSDFFF